MSKFSERLRLLRQEKGELQSEIVSLLGVSPGSYSAYEAGREPKYDILNMIAQHYGVTVDYLTGNSDLRTSADTNISEATGLTHESIQRVRSMNTAGNSAELNLLLSKVGFAKAIHTLWDMRNRKIGSSRYYVLMENEEPNPVPEDVDTQAQIWPYTDLSRIFIEKSKTAMNEAINEVAEELLQQNTKMQKEGNHDAP